MSEQDAAVHVQNLREELSGWCWKRRGAAYAKKDTPAAWGHNVSRRPPSTNPAQTVVRASRLQDTRLACRLPSYSRQSFMGASVMIFKLRLNVIPPALNQPAQLRPSQSSAWHRVQILWFG
ncbi:hypothetical protein D9619_005177 [Psilocybe cf. subviscida]|uniref:Uncharacterized protein n=1 Tax=Psilocybe cf. subviscida TaxID=2480587 RepID=A0A8H5BWW6_9AGAR|nr:hypothetical protein D9619_005177 [Psilocybe cf. subviscida]